MKPFGVGDDSLQGLHWQDCKAFHHGVIYHGSNGSSLKFSLGTHSIFGRMCHFCEVSTVSNILYRNEAFFKVDTIANACSLLIVRKVGILLIY